MASNFDTELQALNLSIAEIKEIKTICQKNKIDLSANNKIEIISFLQNSNSNIESLIKLLKESKGNIDNIIWNNPNMASYEKALKREIFILKSKPSNPVTEKACPRCKVERKVEFLSIQTRGGDEPQTTYNTCQTCGEKWKD
jgi:DNA-directed RNA polymerase subunit M/transcription elongation factor TFIIS